MFIFLVDLYAEALHAHSQCILYQIMQHPENVQYKFGRNPFIIRSIHQAKE